MKNRLLLILILFGLFVVAKADDNRPLSKQQLVKLVSGNTMIGLTCHTRSLYVLFFYPDGKLYFRKNADPKQTYMGRWWVKGDVISSQWPTYKRSGANHLRYYHLNGNVYRPFNVNNACGPAGTFGQPFVVLKGKFQLTKLP